jgi:hypothetical protein
VELVVAFVMAVVAVVAVVVVMVVMAVDVSCGILLSAEALILLVETA